MITISKTSLRDRIQTLGQFTRIWSHTTDGNKVIAKHFGTQVWITTKPGKLPKQIPIMLFGIRILNHSHIHTRHHAISKLEG